MKTLEDVVSESQQRETMVAEKAARYVIIRARMNKKLAIGGVVLSLIMSSFLLYLADFLFLFVLLPMGGLAGYVIGKCNVGIILGMIVFAASQGIGFAVCTALNVPNLGDAAYSNNGYGSIIAFFAIVGYSVAGSILGLANYWFDRDHLQI